MGRDDRQRFPEIIRAGRLCIEATAKVNAAESQVSEAKWALGDALIAECGPPGKSGVRTKAYSLLKQAAAVLKKMGLRYSFDHLRDLRQVAHQHPPGERSPAEASWSVHWVAGSPEKLRKIIDAAKAAGKELTVKFARRWIKADKHSKDPRPDHDAADTAIFEEELIKVAAESARQFEALLKSPHLPKIDPRRASDIVDRWDVVVQLAQGIQIALHNRTTSDTARSEAAE
jgi:hypothetical protein